MECTQVHFKSRMLKKRWMKKTNGSNGNRTRFSINRGGSLSYLSDKPKIISRKEWGAKDPKEDIKGIGTKDLKTHYNSILSTTQEQR